MTKEAIPATEPVKSMRTQLLDFYGVKMINNTRGTGEILGSRMLRIQTRKIPEGLKKEFGNLLPAESTRISRFRDELHSGRLITSGGSRQRIGRFTREPRTVRTRLRPRSR